MKILLPFLGALTAVLLSSCATTPTTPVRTNEKLAIANSVPPEVALNRVGITVFGNKQTTTEVPELGSRMNRILRNELGKHYQVAATRSAPEIPKAILSTRDSTIIGNWRRKHLYPVASQSGSKLLAQATRHSYYPYGMPSSMQSNGFGVYSGGLGRGITVVFYGGFSLFDVEQDLSMEIDSWGGLGASLAGPKYVRTGKLANKWDGQSMGTLSEGDRAVVLKLLEEAFEGAVQSSFAKYKIKH